MLALTAAAIWPASVARSRRSTSMPASTRSGGAPGSSVGTVHSKQSPGRPYPRDRVRPPAADVRVVTSFGPLVAGLLVGVFGSFNNVTAAMSCCAIFSIIAVIIGRETKGAELPK